MGIFDKLKSTAKQAVNTAATSAASAIGSKRETFTYFSGSTPDNDYTPTQPYTIVIESNHVSEDEPGYIKLFIPCGGADTPRPIKLRKRGRDGKWFLWEQYLLAGVRTPKSADPWA